MRWAPDVGLEELSPPRGGATYLSSIAPDIPGALIYETTWIQGGVRYAYDPDTATFADTGMVPVGEFDNLEGYVAKELVIPSHDGVMIPLTILHKEGLALDGKNPTVVYGYGSYGSSMNVGFSATRIAWLEKGGVWAIAHVRGGGEYGQEWHYAGAWRPSQTRGVTSSPPGNIWFGKNIPAQPIWRPGEAAREEFSQGEPSPNGRISLELRS